MGHYREDPSPDQDDPHRRDPDADCRGYIGQRRNPLIGAATATLGADAPFWSSYANWWVADGIGMLLVTPLIVTLAAKRHELKLILTAQRLPELLAFAAAWIFFVWFFFATPHFDGPDAYVGPYMVLPLLIWAALRFHPCITTLALTILAVVALNNSDLVFASLLHKGAPSTNPLTYVQIYLAVIAASALLLAASVFERREAEQHLRISAAALETQEGIMILDPAHVILRVNHAFTRITGYSSEEAVGRRGNLLRSSRHDDAFFHKLRDTVTETGSWQGEVWNRRKNGEIFPAWHTLSAVRNRKGTVTHHVSTFIDISERKMTEERLHQLAFCDPLTQLPNRRLLLDRLAHVLEGSARRRAQSAIMFIDLDNFKLLNDTQGHDVGDRLLLEAAKRLRASVRQADTVARLGGDEFVVLIETIEGDGRAVDHAETIAQKILAALGEPYELEIGTGDRIEYRCTASIGVVLAGAVNSADADELLKQADLAMYQAKASGRNAVRFFAGGARAAARLAAETGRAETEA